MAKAATEVNMKATFYALMALLILAGCASSTSYYTMMQAGGAIRVEPADSADHDFTVSIRNEVDFDFDGDVLADRERALRVMFASQCSATRIVREAVIESGAWITGKPLRTYVSKVACTRRS